MNHEERAAWIRRGIIALLAVIVVVGVWLFPEKKPPPATVAEAPKYDLEVVHFHQPGNPESDEIASSLAKIAVKYQKIVLVSQVDMTTHPAEAAAQGVKKAPSVIMSAGGKRVFAFRGKWAHAQIERKVDEILRGLKAVGKDWRPDVKGFDSGGKTAPGPPGVVAPSGNTKPVLPDPQSRETPAPKP